MSLTNLLRHGVLPAFLLLHGAPLQAEVVTDGTVGDKVIFNGQTITIDQLLGMVKGGNLFHSFLIFDVNSGQTVTFTGADFIKNLIVRVTGDDVSNINGTLHSKVGHANFFLINPSGIVFGKGAAVNVPAGFHVSTADEIRLADGGVFSATHPKMSVLTSGAPESFGFLGGNHAALRIDGANLHFKPGQRVSFTAGDLVIDSATIVSSGGEIRLRAVGDGKAGVGIHDDVDAKLRDAQYDGDMRIDNSKISTTGDGGGLIIVQAGNLNLEHSDLTAANTGTTDSTASQGIRLGISGDLNMQDGSLDSSIWDSGDGGQIKVDAGDINIHGNYTGIFSSSNCFGAPCGSAGNIRINAANTFNMFNQSVIGSSTWGNGNAGSINISAKNINLFDSALITDNARGTGNAGNITISARNTLNLSDNAHIASITVARGNGGDLSVNVGNALNIFDNAGIFTFTYGGGDAGNIRVQADNVTLDGNGNFASIASGNDASNCTAASGCNGDTGNITLNVREDLTLINNGVIFAYTTSRGDAGSVLVNAGDVTIDGQGNRAGIFAPPVKDGVAGDITVNAKGAIKLIDGGQISTDTKGHAQAGEIIASAESIIIDGQGNAETGFFSRAAKDSSGQAGNISLNAGHILVTDNGQISIESDANVSGQDLKNAAKTAITLRAGELELRNGGIINASSTGNAPASSIDIKVDKLTIDNAAITTAARNADGGPISIQSGLTQLTDSRITTSAGGNGDGGDIHISGKTLILDGGFIQANAAGEGASGGDVGIQAETLLASHGQLQVGGDQPYSFRPGFNVIQAASPNGVSGTVTTTSPELNITGAMLNLKSDFLNKPDLNANPCAAGQGSSFVQAGHGGLPHDQDGEVYVPEHFADVLNKQHAGDRPSEKADAIRCAEHRDAALKKL